MSAYHQMGHHSENLLSDKHLNHFSGAILSPVNYNEQETVVQVSSGVENGRQFDWVFDPQLYYPKSERGKLQEWSYFPNDVDTVDLTASSWWEHLLEEYVNTCLRLPITSACSPAIAPRVFSNQYYVQMTELGTIFAKALRDTDVSPLQTVLVSLADLSVSTRALEVASIISRTSAERIYLVIVSDTEPRRELSNPEEIKGIMKLIRVLADSGIEVVVGYCAGDLVLWKEAGAKTCATGKFFNLRRFTSSRFDDASSGGGGQLPYWFEESLMAFLRESDVIRVYDAGIISSNGSQNPFGNPILRTIFEGHGKAWLALSWRQYLWAFADLESRLDAKLITADQLLRVAERSWLNVEERDILMEEMRNDGQWVRAWRRAILEYSTF